MPNVYISFETILVLIILTVVVAIMVVGVVSTIIMGEYNKKFKVNCYRCKHYKLHDVNSCGGCTYKCTIKDRIDKASNNCHNHYERCKSYECKNVEE